MQVLARGSWSLLLFASALLAQQPDEPEPAPFVGDPWQLIERDNKLIDLQWRRDANGDLEWAIAGQKDAKWKRLWGNGLADVFAMGGLAGYAVPLLHHGDLLSLADGEQHFRRLGLATDTAALAAFARAPLGKTPSRVEELDRLVAVDVLLARGDEAKAALAQIAGDEKAPAAVRARASRTAPPRERLRADELVLPERVDLCVMIDHGRLGDAHGLLGLARFVGLVSTSQVIERLKRPRLDDATLGQAESDSLLELPFELVRHLGAMRFDHSCASITWTGEVGGACTWTCTAAGSFEPVRIVSGLRGLTGSGFEVSASRASARANGVDVAARPALASHLLRDGAYSVRVHVPSGSKVLSLFALERIANVTSYELEVTLGDPIVVAEVLTMTNAEEAAAAAPMFRYLAERVAHDPERAEMLAALGTSDLPVKSERSVTKNVIRCSSEVPAAKYPFVAMGRKWVLEQGRGY